MGKILNVSCLLLMATMCQAKHDHGCCRKIDAINKNALSLEEQFQEIQALAESLVAGGCCGGGGGGGDCVCVPTPIVDAPSPIVLNTPGTYCLTLDLTTSELNPGEGVVIDLNGHSVYNIFGSNNFTVKNGTVINQLAGSDNVVAYGVKVPYIGGGDGTITLVDCTGLLDIYSVDNIVLLRCSGGDDYLDINTQTHKVTMIDSYFGHEVRGDEYLESLKIYQSTLKAGLNLLGMTNLREFSIYGSTLGNLSLIGAYTNPVRMLIESSVLSNCEFGQVAGVTTFDSGLITRSLLGQALFKHCVGVTLNASEVVGECSFDQCENIECDNDSVHQVDSSALIIDNGRSIVLRDCFATAPSTNPAHAAYSFNGTTTALNVLNCYAKGCPVGFFINNPTNGFEGIIKECFADGCSQASYKQSNGQVSLFPYSNVAISNAGVPVANYDTNAFTTFNPLVTSLTAIETDTVTSWRNISFELP